MSDYDPLLNKPGLDRPGMNPAGRNDRAYDDAVFEPRSPSRGLYLVVGVVAAIVAAAGLMFFSGDANDRNDMARSPDPGALNAPSNETRTPTIPMRPAETMPAPEQAPRQ